MAEKAVSSVIQYLAPLLTGEVELLKGVRKEIINIKVELERKQAFLEDVESREEKGDKGVKTWVTRTITKLKSRHEIASQIQDIKTTIREIQEGAVRYGLSTSTSSEHSSTGTSSITKDNMWSDPRLASLFIGNDEVFGIESPKYELTSRLVTKINHNEHKGSRVIITTRNRQVVGFCKETLVDHVHEHQPLSEEKAWELFCKKAFQLDFGGHCPLELKEISHEIVRKCEGLPLAIVAIGGLLSTKDKVISEWQKFYGSMGTELERNPNLTNIRQNFVVQL
ncbi:disease resistance protein RGA5-like [Camellia sinensis]|uniref:disease resistance protein RGA5-like n=1 Tax=Camellia sinensis TaxID=4442 RepID=UPI001035EE58|nr:disease resistance protein RGA5-like [Camellia sinensis]